MNYQDIHTEGITRITDIDFKYAGKMGTSIKLFGSSRMEGDQVFAWVAPVMIGTDHPLYAVSDVYNGILVKGNMLGTSMYYGSGAGKLPTASAVVADIMEAAKNPDVNIPLGWTGQKLEIAPMEVSSHRYFVRISGRYESQKEMVEQCLGACRIVTLEGLNEYAALTEKKSERQFKEELKKLEERLDSVYQGVLQTIRAEL